MTSAQRQEALITHHPTHGQYCKFTAHASATSTDSAAALQALVNSAHPALLVVKGTLQMLRTNTPTEIFDATSPSNASTSTKPERGLVHELLGILHEGITHATPETAVPEMQFLPPTGQGFRALMFNLLDL